jgi:hypothetical protein
VPPRPSRVVTIVTAASGVDPASTRRRPGVDSMLRTFTARHIATQVPAAAVTASRRPADPHRGLTVGYGRWRRQPLPGPARSGPVLKIRGLLPGLAR